MINTENIHIQSHINSGEGYKVEFKDVIYG